MKIKFFFLLLLISFYPLQASKHIPHISSTSSYKVKPVDPGGRKIEYIDKKVYDCISR